MTKICKGCNNELPATIEFFYREYKNRDGLRGKCKKCSAIRKVKDTWSYCRWKEWSNNHIETRVW